MFAWESNGALSEHVLRIRREGGESLFLEMQAVTQPRVHVCIHPLHHGFYFFFWRGEMGGREEKINKITSSRQWNPCARAAKWFMLALASWDCRKMVREEELKPSWCSLFHLMPCLCWGSALDFVSAVSVETSLHSRCPVECPLLAEAGPVGYWGFSCCYSCS